MSKLRKALEKAKDARRHGGVVDRAAGQKRSEGFIGSRLSKWRGDRSELRIQYTHTRVLGADSHALKENKVFSLFHDHQMTDQLKILRTQVLNTLDELGGNSLLITSANPCEGKTFTAINLAVTIAHEVDRAVLLVDTDLRQAVENHCDFALDFFGMEMERGLSDYLLGEAEIPDLLMNPGIDKLTILPAGKPLPRSSELLGSPGMESLVREMKYRYPYDRVVIFDSASLLTCSDPLVLSRFIDGVLLVVEAEKTTPDDLKRALALLKGKNVLGTVLNKFRS